MTNENLEVWETRYTDPKTGRKESVRVFQIFQKYLVMVPRSLKKLTQEVYFPDESLRNLTNVNLFQ